MKLGGPHACGDSRLTCIDCSGQICPSCMEQCPVGNRCKKCSSRFQGHITKFPPLVMARTAAGAAVVGFVFGFFESVLWGGFYMWFVLYAIGFAIGKGLHKLASHKLGAKVIATMLGGLLIGVILSPCRDAMFGLTSTTAMVAGRSMGEAQLANSSIKAKKHFAEFETAFKARKPKQDFYVRAPFLEGENIDHLWVNVSGIDGQKIEGKVEDEPSVVANIHDGDDTTVQVSDLEDWYYKDEHGKQVGGFSLKKQNLDADDEAISKFANPYRTSSIWMSFLILCFGVISPVLAVRVRN